MDEPSLLPVEANKNNIPLIQVTGSKDPMVILQMAAGILNSEIARYKAAVEKEGIETHGRVNGYITDLAKSIIAGAKKMAEIQNPKAFSPQFGNMYQQNNYHFPNALNEELDKLPEEDQKAFMQIIEAQIVNEPGK